MDVALGMELPLEEPVTTYLATQMGIGDAMMLYQYLTVQSMLIDGTKNQNDDGNVDVTLVCSEVQDERKRTYHQMLSQLSNFIANLDEVLDDRTLGSMTITVRRANTARDNALWKERREMMLTALRHILFAWASMRKRILVAIVHSGEFKDDGSMKDDHIHVLYVKEEFDGSAQLKNEITKFVENDCSWQTIDTSLGMFGAAEVPDFDDEYDEGELFDDDIADDDLSQDPTTEDLDFDEDNNDIFGYPYYEEEEPTFDEEEPDMPFDVDDTE